MMDALRNLEFQEAEEFMRKVDLPLDEDEQMIADRFRITDIDQANWALRKISAYKEKQKEVDSLAEAELFRIKQWQEREAQSIEHSIAYFEGLLAAFLMERRKLDPRYKISTPYGKVSTRKQQAKWDYDEESVLFHLKAIGATELIRVKEEVNKAALKKQATVEENKALLDDVEISGIRITEQPEKIVVEVE